ncbi:rab9 effector protein with kelch motifs [Nematolebias whitei]|uniref:rab9 effector protein with kelch motifs n=1 Tax=Nematolebias whitei TaxID=451745 RepID=UPI001896A747|nr:rab9 effector protein with kelch motifs [Nematolebias whitei]
MSSTVQDAGDTLDRCAVFSPNQRRPPHLLVASLIEGSDKMGKLDFYVIWSLSDAPRQFVRKANRKCFQVHIPLPLPKQVVIFGVGEWLWDETTLLAEVLVCEDVPAQIIGTLSSQVKCLTWEGDWSDDITRVSAAKGRRGLYGKLVLKVCGEQLQDDSSVLSSTQLFQRRRLFPEEHSEADRSNTSHQRADGETVTSDSSHMSSGVCCAQIQVTKIDTSNSAHPAVWPTRWCHTMCLSDPDTAVLIGGETSEQNYCKDSLWKLELDRDFWFPVNSTASGPVPPCARGHTATYDPDSKAVYVYGGLTEGPSNSVVYIMNTLSWKWTLVTAKGNVPHLAYHSAVIYKKELFVFGGVQSSRSQGDGSCSNALYIFNPEHELWYKPIVEGNKPLSRFGHSSTLLSQKLVIFGGQKTATYLNDLHVLDLGMMEYTAVKSANMPPLPRGFHAAVPVLDDRILISGGCSAIGALLDVHIFNIDTLMWSSVASPQLCSKPRAGHSMINLGCTIPVQSETPTQGDTNITCTLLVFGGSDCSGSFYDDTLRCTVEITNHHIQPTMKALI